MPKITKKLVESLEPHTSKDFISWDDDLKGFGIVVLPTGRKTYVIQYRNQERVKKRFKIGTHGELTAEEAREAARKKLGEVALGGDPAREKIEFRLAPMFHSLCSDYLEKYAREHKRDKSYNEDERLIHSFLLPAFGKMRTSQVRSTHVQELHRQLKNTPYQANRVLSLLSKMFSLAEFWGMNVKNPVKGIKRYQDPKRQKFLDTEELRLIWSKLQNHPGSVSADALKLLILTGARQNEVLKLEWSHLDFKKGIWEKPSHLTKQKRKEHLPLSAKAVELLMSIKKNSTSKYVFPGQSKGTHLKKLDNFWKRILEATNLEGVRIHDLRHTYASHLVSGGLSLSVVGKLLGHTQASTTHRYAHLQNTPLQEATELFSGILP